MTEWNFMTCRYHLFYTLKQNQTIFYYYIKIRDNLITALHAKLLMWHQFGKKQDSEVQNETQ